MAGPKAVIWYWTVKCMSQLKSGPHVSAGVFHGPVWSQGPVLTAITAADITCSAHVDYRVCEAGERNSRGVGNDEGGPTLSGSFASPHLQQRDLFTHVHLGWVWEH